MPINVNGYGRGQEILDIKERLEELENKAPSEGGTGSTVTSSSTNGNIKINGTETKVYDDTSIKNSISGKADINHTHTDLDSRITTLENAEPVASGGGDTVTHSGTNGSINVNGVDIAVYNDSDVRNLITAKADINHGHTINQVSGLVDSLAAKSDINHTHSSYETRLTNLENATPSSNTTVEQYDDTEIRSELALKADKTELHSHTNKSILDAFSLDLDGTTLLYNGKKVDSKNVNTYATSSTLPEAPDHGTLATVGADIYVYDKNADPQKVEKSPTMTANADPASGFTAYSNSENTGTESYKAFDNSTTTFFAPAGNTGSGMKYVGLSFGGNLLTIDTVDVLAYGADTAGYNPKNWSISILNESDVWVTVYSNTAETWTSGAYKTFTFTPVKAKDIRFNVTATHLSSYKPYFKDINVYGTTSGKWIRISAKDVSTQTIAAAGNVNIATTKTNPAVSVQIATANAGEYRNVKDSDLIDVLITSGNVKIVNNGSSSVTLRIIIS